MINFKDPVLGDKSWIDNILALCGGPGSDDTFGSIFVWRKAYKTKVCFYKDFLLRSYIESEKEKYRFPTGKGNVSEVLSDLVNEAKEKNIDLIFGGMTQNNVKILKDLMPGKFVFNETRGEEDYIYSREDLAYLKGKSFHSKRNHISKFNRAYKWFYNDISLSNLSECKEFIDKWFILNQQNKEKGITAEYDAINEAFNNYEALDFVGGIIKVDNSIVALTMGEKINNEIFDVHFEKALISYDGIYALINNEFVKRKLADYRYINREEDLDLPGLRKVKLSYKPVVILKRYEAELIN